MREKSFFHSYKKDQRKLETLRGMKRHQRDTRIDVVLIGVTHQRRMIEKLVETLASVARIACCVHQFLKVLNARERFRSSFIFELFHISAAIDEELDHFGNRGGIARRAEALRTLLFWSFAESLR